MILKLLFIFIAIGGLSFGGGYAVIPLISKYVVHENAWLTMKELVDLISISQMTPGPIAINAATFVGQKIWGLRGALITTGGIVLPQFILMMLLGYYLFTKNKKFAVLDYSLIGIKAGIVPLIFITALDLFKSSVFKGPITIKNLSVPAGICFILALILYNKKVNLFKLIIMGAVLGIALETGLMYI